MNNSQNISTSKKIAANTIYQLLGKAVSMSVTIFATLMITRYYGREYYGWFNLMQNIPALFFIIADFGLNAVAARELSDKEQDTGKYIGNILMLRIALALGIILVSWISLWFFPYARELKLGIGISMFLVLTQALYSTSNLLFQIRLRYDLATISYISGSLLVLVLLVLGVLYRLDIVWINSFYILGGLVTFAFSLAFISKLGVKISYSFDYDLAKNLIIQSLPLGLMFVFSQINFKADSILLSILPVPNNMEFTQTDVVALYGLSYKVFEVTLVLPTFFMNAAYPVYLRHLQQSKEKLSQTFTFTLLGLGGLGLITSLLGVIMARFVVLILGGSEFSASIISLQLLFSGILVFYLTQPISWLIVTLGRQKFLPYVYFVSAVFNVSANVWFIPRYSYLASSVITWVSELIVLILLIFLARRSWNSYYA